MPSERKKELIKEEAKSILDKFAKELEKVKTVESFVEREEDRREEKKDSEKTNNKEFRKIFFENAPSVKGDCLQAEKGKWK